MKSEIKNKNSKLNRRDFLRYCTALASAFGFSGISGKEIAFALEEARAKPPIIWIEAQDCGGCLASIINSEAPSFGTVLLDLISFKYQPELLFDSGESVVTEFNKVVQGNKHVLIVSGSVPIADEGIYSSPFKDKSGKIISANDAVRDAGKNATAVLAVGTCAAFGGIPSAFEQFRVKQLKELLPSKSVINIPGCPPHPDWVIGTVLKMLLFETSPETDYLGRPKMFFNETVHNNCYRRASFEMGEFAANLGDEHKCFYKLGCKGPDTFADCPKRKWNDNINWCIQANSLCIGCTEPRFYAGFSPISSILPEIDIPFAGRQTVDSIGKAGVAVVATGIGAHYGWKAWEKRKHEDRDEMLKLQNIDKNQPVESLDISQLADKSKKD